MDLNAIVHLAWWLPLNAAAGGLVLGPLLLWWWRATKGNRRRL
jgi:hypothetical protein